MKQSVAKLNLLLLAVLVVGCLVVAPGCTTTVEIPKEVKVQVPVPCVEPDKDPRRQRPEVRGEGDLLNMPRGLRTLATWADLIKLRIYTRELEAAVDGCSRLTGR